MRLPLVYNGTLIVHPDFVLVPSSVGYYTDVQVAQAAVKLVREPGFGTQGISNYSIHDETQAFGLSRSDEFPGLDLAFTQHERAHREYV